MTLPLFLAAHLVYGVAMAFAFFRRMHADGEVLGIPLLWTLLPLGAVSFPAGAILLRYAGGWFLHGMFIGDGSVFYERFHLGFMFLVGVLAGAATIAGMFFAIAFLSRERPRIALVPIGLAGLVALLVVALDPSGVFVVAGTGGRKLWMHPVALVSLIQAGALTGMWLFARKRLSAPTVQPSGASIPNRVSRP